MASLLFIGSRVDQTILPVARVGADRQKNISPFGLSNEYSPTTIFAVLALSVCFAFGIRFRRFIFGRALLRRTFPVCFFRKKPGFPFRDFFLRLLRNQICPHKQIVLKL